MSAFPTLKTGAVTQYPASQSLQFSTQVIRFVDGSEQRYREYAQPLRRWIIELKRLDETELDGLREFFRIQVGAAEPFSFTDPWDGATYPTCRIEGDEMIETLLNEGWANTTLVVRQVR